MQKISLGLSAILFSAAVVGHAEIPPISPEKLQQYATIAVEGKILNIESKTRKLDNGMVRRYDTFTLTPTKVLKGTISPQQPLQFVGWTVIDWNGMVGSSGVKNIKSLNKGDRVRVYLENQDNQLSIIAPNGIERLTLQSFHSRWFPFLNRD